jgi:putative ABC transport system permease protein
MGYLIRLGMLVRVGWRSLGRNKVRTLLTMLGIIIGVASVIAIVALGRGAEQRTDEEMESMGNNSIEISAEDSGATKSHAALLEGDVQELKGACPSVVYVTAVEWESRKPIVFESQNAQSYVLGVSPDFFAIHHYGVDAGECFTEDDIRNAAKVCVLGSSTATALFGNRSPVGRVVRLKSMGFKVVGVKTPQTGEGGFMQDENSIFLMPYTTAMRYVQHYDVVDEIVVASASIDDMTKAKDEVEAFLRQHHHIHGNQPNDFRMEDIQAMMDRWHSRKEVFSSLLGGVAAISLFVGGIGIMNIMLVTVTERIREIGTRMAIGANPVDIMLQFLIEALTISLTGGVIGIGLGITLAKVINKKWSYAIVSLDSIWLAFGVSCAIGIIFGLWPAFKASRLDPIEALRHE